MIEKRPAAQQGHNQRKFPLTLIFLCKNVTNSNLLYSKMFDFLCISLPLFQNDRSLIDFPPIIVMRIIKWYKMINKNKFTMKILLLAVFPMVILFIFLQTIHIANSNTLSLKTSTEVERSLFKIYTDVAKMKSQDIVDKLSLQSSGIYNLIDRVKNEEIGHSGFAFLLQGNGDILNISESGVHLFQLSKKVSKEKDTQIGFFNIKSSKNQKIRDLADKMKKSKEYNIYSISDNRGKEYLITFQKIKEYNLLKGEEKSIKDVLYLSLVIPLSDVFAVSHKIKEPIITNFEEHSNIVTIVSIIILLMVLVLATFFALKETKQIRLINDGIANIKKIKLDDPIEIITSDDLGDLAKTFNEMRIEIQTTYKDLKNNAMRLEEKVKERTKEIENKNRQLEELVVRDRLTGLYNRTKLDEVLEYEFNRSKRYNTVFGVIMVDIDFFKKVNDTHGHQAGDTVLCEFANLLQDNSRETDTVGRWGGEEFLIVVENINKDAILMLAEKLRVSVDEYEFSIVKHKTASFGVSIYQTGDEINKIIARADLALYKAKSAGRNRVESL